MKALREEIELDVKELEAIIERTRGTLSDAEREKLKAAVAALGQLVGLVEDKNTSIQKLRQILFGASTEKTQKVLGAVGGSAGGGGKEKQPKEKAKGHGRNGAAAYRGAERVKIQHE